jgi:hypothetical protein
MKLNVFVTVIDKGKSLPFSPRLRRKGRKSFLPSIEENIKKSKNFLSLPAKERR